MKTGIKDLQDQTRHMVHIHVDTTRALELFFQVNTFARQNKNNNNNRNLSGRQEDFSHELLDILYISTQTYSHAVHKPYSISVWREKHASISALLLMTEERDP